MVQRVKYFYCPDEFWPAFGYEGQAQYVAIYWTPYGDEAEFNDGRMGGTADWMSYCSLTEHPINKMALSRSGIRSYQLGSSDTKAQLWLIVNRETHKAQVAPPEEAHRVLKAQWGDPELSEPLVLTEEQLAEIEERMQAAFSEVSARVQNIDVAALMQEHREQLKALEGALDAALERVVDLYEEWQAEAQEAYPF